MWTFRVSQCFIRCYLEKMGILKNDIIDRERGMELDLARDEDILDDCAKEARGKPFKQTLLALNVFIRYKFRPKRHVYTILLFHPLRGHLESNLRRCQINRNCKWEYVFVIAFVAVSWVPLQACPWSYRLLWRFSMFFACTDTCYWAFVYPFGRIRRAVQCSPGSEKKPSHSTKIPSKRRQLFTLVRIVGWPLDENAWAE